MKRALSFPPPEPESCCRRERPSRARVSVRHRSRHIRSIQHTGQVHIAARRINRQRSCMLAGRHSLDNRVCIRHVLTNNCQAPIASAIRGENQASIRVITNRIRARSDRQCRNYARGLWVDDCHSEIAARSEQPRMIGIDRQGSWAIASRTKSDRTRQCLRRGIRRRSAMPVQNQWLLGP